MNHCHVCKTMLPDDAEICNFCGEKQQNPAYGAPEDQSPPVSGRLMILFVVLIASIIFAWIYHTRLTAPTPRPAHQELPLNIPGLKEQSE
mgnify:CR=1 FL=1